MGSELKSSIASKIGGELLKSVGGAIAGAAMGRVLSSIGMGDDGTKKALDEILAELSEIRKSIENLEKEMATGFAQLNINLAWVNISSIVANNTATTKTYELLLAHPDDSSLRDILKDQLKFYEPSLLYKWHGAISGDFIHSGIIQSHSELVRAKHVMYGPSAALEVEKAWDYFDGQQSLLALYLVEQLNALGRGTAIQGEVLVPWENNRSSQLKLLRGTVRKVDIFTGVKGPTTTSIASLPDGSIIEISKNRMWCRHIPAVRNERTRHDFEKALAWHFQQQEEFSGLSGWYVPRGDLLYSMMRVCGAKIFDDADANYFQEAMRKKDFTFALNCAFVDDSSFVHPHHAYVMMEGIKNLISVHGDGDVAGAFLCRDISGNETYFY